MMDTIKRHFRPEQLREFSLVFLIVAIFLFFGSQIQGYFSPRIFNRVTSDVAIIAVVAVGETVIDDVVAPPGVHAYVTGEVPPVHVSLIVTD